MRYENFVKGVSKFRKYSSGILGLPFPFNAIVFLVVFTGLSISVYLIYHFIDRYYWIIILLIIAFFILKSFLKKKKKIQKAKNLIEDKNMNVKRLTVKEVNAFDSENNKV